MLLFFSICLIKRYCDAKSGSVTFQIQIGRHYRRLHNVRIQSVPLRIMAIAILKIINQILAFMHFPAHNSAGGIGIAKQIFSNSLFYSSEMIHLVFLHDRLYSMHSFWCPFNIFYARSASNIYDIYIYIYIYDQRYDLYYDSV